MDNLSYMQLNHLNKALSGNTYTLELDWIAKYKPGNPQNHISRNITIEEAISLSKHWGDYWKEVAHNAEYFKSD